MNEISNSGGVITAGANLNNERGGSKIYIVNDDFNLLVMLRAILEDSGFSDIEIYNNGIEVINVVNSGGRPNLIISDIKMPEMDGFQLVREIKSNLDDSVHNIPFIFISAVYDDFQSRALAKNLGVSYFFTMPLDQKGLVESVRKILGQPDKAAISDNGQNIDNFAAPKIKLLILEDDIFVSKLLLYTLKDMGLEIKTAETVMAFNNVFHEFMPEICLLDYSLPDGNGSDVLKTVKNFDPRIKAIMMTSGANEKMVDDFIHDGADNFIKKPIDMRQLVNSITTAADGIKAEWKVNRQIKIKTETVFAEEKFFDFFENAPVALAILDYELNIIKSNREFRTLLSDFTEMNSASCDNCQPRLFNILNILNDSERNVFKEQVLKVGFSDNEKKIFNYIVKNLSGLLFNLKMIINGRMAEQNSQILYRVVINTQRLD
ncbi:MAG: response regulator [Candidatus Wallbacteria bacterium]